MRLIDAENFEAFDGTLPIQIAPKGMRARKIASFFYAEGCKRVLESIDAASTIDPESLRPTAHWIKEDSFYKDSTVWRCAACKGKFVLHGETPENENYQYCPACSAIIIKDGQGR